MSWMDVAKSIMRSKGMTQPALAESIGVTQGALSHWLNGRRQADLPTLQAIAGALGVSIAYLLNGDEGGLFPSFGNPLSARKEVSLVDSGNKPVPVINTIQAGLWKEICGSFAPDEVIMTHLDVSSSAFCLIIEGLSMAPDYMPGDRVIIDPRVMPSPGDCVAAINNKNEGTFKRYKEKGTGANGVTIFELVPINQDYPTMRSDVERIEILGTMVEHRKYRRR